MHNTAAPRKNKDHGRLKVNEGLNKDNENNVPGDKNEKKETTNQAHNLKNHRVFRQTF